MSIVLKNKINVDKNFINDLITKSWEDSESIQNQIDSIELDSDTSIMVVKLLKDLLTSYYVFTGCLENIVDDSAEATEPASAIEPEEIIVPEKLTVIPEIPQKADEPDVDFFSEFDTSAADSEPFEYFVDFDEPVGEPLTDDDLYS